MRNSMILNKLKSLYTILPNYLDLKLLIDINDNTKSYDLIVLDYMKSLKININEITQLSGVGIDIVNADGTVNEENLLIDGTFMIFSYTYNDADNQYRTYMVLVDISHISDIKFINSLKKMIVEDYNKFIHKDKRICIAGSLSVADKIEEIAKYFEKEGYQVYYAKKSDRSLLDIDYEFIKAIDWCDEFIIVPKEDGSIGDSVTYEKAIAKYFNKKIITWNNYEKKGK